MSIQERIKKIESYFCGMQVDNVGNEQIIYVMVHFLNDKWGIIHDTQQKYSVTVGNDYDSNGKLIYYFCGNIEIGFDTIFDAIDYNIDKNETQEKRAILFKEKVLELQSLFEDEEIPLSALKKIEFKVKKKKNKQEPQSVEDVVENIMDENNDEE